MRNLFLFICLINASQSVSADRLFDYFIITPRVEAGYEFYDLNVTNSTTGALIASNPLESQSFSNMTIGLTIGYKDRLSLDVYARRPFEDLDFFSFNDQLEAGNTRFSGQTVDFSRGEWSTNLSYRPWESDSGKYGLLTSIGWRTTIAVTENIDFFSEGPYATVGSYHKLSDNVTFTMNVGLTYYQSTLNINVPATATPNVDLFFHGSGLQELGLKFGASYVVAVSDAISLIIFN